MKKWVLKAFVQKAISFLPYKHKINYLFQKYVTKGVQLSEYYFEDRLEHLQQHSSFYSKYKGKLNDIKILELGTGWYPVIPLGFFLSGAQQIYTVDITPLMDKQKVEITLERYLEYLQNGQLDSFKFKKKRIETLQSILEQIEQLTFHDLLEKLNIRYLVEDATKLSVPSNNFDLITSNNTFEHVEPAVLRGILTEFVRVLKPGGLMSHFIDMSDHFAHLDQSISIYNFLQFSEKQWEWIDNSIQPQNRWRINHFRKLYQSLNIPITEELNRPGDLEALASIRLGKEFNSIPKEELAISHSYLISSY